ncbi:MAG: TRAP transporter large permease [Sulfitobacter litoralis]|jgi:tripartite ATP-independent transporter DctM subunit|uniref:TRAP transporter large permease protein n=2 Tax=root TaxID=1 RepID=A0A1H0RNA3_9RHOB|nr:MULTISPECIES: TRAP transporter large permease [Sulfitobacter]MBQ0716602.1 TRAP transporter large permease [Sulfitobacter litoralis]MBQ0764932.1 TRAP transporter large permease [Sulfitobacter litoralis]MBQ0801386.1 TRAP transporter large permease [Sulfitobacter litoralis]MCF7726796.1 TRAP transporter large permease subunit [Sulfitobacter sp. M22]MCF7778172.1 TRAP transporter large permease subunit [Sulfitobacter sp. M220]|tara:strand:- start:1101 stop:2441 length:1341 start_codon:yes stop_codon:yes gene_type:complete
MDASTIGLIAFAAVLILLALRVPIAFALASVATIATFFIFAFRTGTFMPERAIRATTSMVFSNSFDLIHSYDLSMIPLFVALGHIAYRADITTKIYHAAKVWLTRLPGGVAMASVMGCGGFSAITGSSIACASTMGKICTPEMLRMGYDPRLATASVAAGGTLGSLIPPSVLFIIYGIFTETSISSLFLAGVLPGLLTLAGFILVIAVWVWRSPEIAPSTATRYSTKERFAAAAESWPAVMLFVLIIGGIYGGIFTATEAAAVCVVAATLIGFAQRKLTLQGLWDAVKETCIQTAAIFFIAAGAKIFVAFIALTNVAPMIVNVVAEAELSVVVLLLAIAAIYLLLGMFLDPIGIMVLTLPLMIPLVESYDMNLIWFGVVVIKLLEIGLITPPVGLNVFVIANVVGKEAPIDKIFAGITRFLSVDVIVLVLIMSFPMISLLIPMAAR